jgi:hypothetical protein
MRFGCRKISPEFDDYKLTCFWASERSDWRSTTLTWTSRRGSVAGADDLKRVGGEESVLGLEGGLLILGMSCDGSYEAIQCILIWNLVVTVCWMQLSIVYGR